VQPQRLAATWLEIVDGLTHRHLHRELIGETVRARIGMIVKIIRQRFGAALRAPVMTTGIAHRGDEPRAHVIDLRAVLQEREEDFLDEIFGVGIRNAELATRDVEQQRAMLDVEALDFVRGCRRRRRRGHRSRRGLRHSLLLTSRSRGGRHHFAGIVFEHAGLFLA